MNQMQYTLGIDIGSTTVKIAILDENHQILFSDYKRHFANIQETLSDLLKDAYTKLGNITLHPMITGSGGLTLANYLQVPFVQEVIAVSTSLQELAPKTDVAIELGGEDAKIIYFENGNVEQRMNGICAGGTGSFIDQMASLLQTDAAGLNEYAKSYRSLYTIAARCGVFAKSDIQPLINDGATKEDLSASIFQAVVNQTISGLACGKPIRGHVAFLGGPLHFLSELKKAFIRTLNLDDEHVIDTANSHLFAAIGSALNAKEDVFYTMEEMVNKLSSGIKMEFEVERMEPLFASQEEYDAFCKRHDSHCVKTAPLETYTGNCYLGIDAGSTTTKAALVGEDGSLLYSFYSNNNGSPLKTAIGAIQDIYKKLPAGAKIVRSCSTGYGEALMKAAFLLDDGEVETVAHYYAAAFFDPKVDCILDIGGQDMKCIKIKNHTVDSVQLNEACSSGCGSFIETFAKSLNYSVQDFAKAALFAEHPIDLGTRCTVFMNSKVKQAQKEGASVSDISAGLAYSVIKNALFKVIKVSDASELGSQIVVQGGTFYNDAVLRSFEKIAGCEAIRPDIAGIMGAFGAALIAREHYTDGYQTSMLSIDAINSLEFDTSMAKCKGCTNNCRLTINRFSGGRQYISGNRCERGLGKQKNPNQVPNLFDYKLKRLFSYEPLTADQAPRGPVGIPRVLNMYENYPFWFTFFTKLGYQVILSPASNHNIYSLGIESIPSESECYPAKLAHGHVTWLIKQGVPFIFYPALFYERNETPDANNHYNCPIVTSYSENIKNNVEEIGRGEVKFRNPFMAFSSLEVATEALIKEFSDIPAEEVTAAARAGWDEMAAARDDMRKKGEEVLAWMEANHKRGIVLAGRPYHVDPTVNHSIPDLINQLGMAVLSEDGVSMVGGEFPNLRVMNQWTWHSRLYKAAEYVTRHPDLELVELNSFGCGLDAVVTDQVQEIMSKRDRLYTCLKIDQSLNLGAVRIRLRSLKAAIQERIQDSDHVPEIHYAKAEFTEEMKNDKDYTILVPEMSPIHFPIIQAAARAAGYNVKVLSPVRADIDEGLASVNNDACYPAIITIGSLMRALKSGEYDLNRTALMMSQTGGMCRASNYIGFIHKALDEAGLSQIPVISLNTQGFEPQPGFKFSLSLATNLVQAVIYGDALQQCLYRTRPYELTPGSAEILCRDWQNRCCESILKGESFRKYKKNLANIIKDFDRLPLNDSPRRPRIGIVGEIYVKFSPIASNDIVHAIEANGGEAETSGMLDFFLYGSLDSHFQRKFMDGSMREDLKDTFSRYVLEWYRKPLEKAVKNSKRFHEITSIEKMAKRASQYLSLGNRAGEGWFLTADMIDLLYHECRGVVCLQPFACLPNHITGEGMVHKLHSAYPEAVFLALDCDASASEVNQANRLKLMMSALTEKSESKDDLSFVRKTVSLRKGTAL